ncbi:MAG: oligosaccharide flippase family protein, partial [Eubacteriales bacterium]
MKKNSFLTNTVILTATSVFLRILGIYLTAFLTGKIGTEGIGLFQLIFSVYMLAAAFAVSGISVAVTRLVAEEAMHTGASATTVLKKSITFAVIVSTCISLILYNLAGFIGTDVLNDPRTITALRILAPSLPFMAVSACLRGYLVGKGKIAKTASSSIFEEVVRIGIIICTINYFLPQGLEVACWSIVIASLGSEVLGCLYLLILYKTGKRKKATVPASQKGVLKKILGISMPIAANSYLRSTLRTVEVVLIPSSLVRFGLSGQQALSQYGIIVGMCMPVLFFPTVLLFSMST